MRQICRGYLVNRLGFDVTFLPEKSIGEYAFTLLFSPSVLLTFPSLLFHHLIFSERKMGIFKLFAFLVLLLVMQLRGERLRTSSSVRYVELFV